MATSCAVRRLLSPRAGCTVCRATATNVDVGIGARGGLVFRAWVRSARASLGLGPRTLSVEGAVPRPTALAGNGHDSVEGGWRAQRTSEESSAATLGRWPPGWRHKPRVVRSAGSSRSLSTVEGRYP